MSDFTKPPQRPMPAPVPRTSAPDLTPVEVELLQAYRGTTDHQQHNMLLGMKGIAKACPRVTQPALHLITGGAS